MVNRFGVRMADIAVAVENFERGAFALPNRRDANERAERIDDAPAFANNASHIFGRDLQFDIDGMCIFSRLDMYLIWIVHQRLGDIFDEFLNVHTSLLLCAGQSGARTGACISAKHNTNGPPQNKLAL